MAPECDEEIDDENDGDEPVQGELDEHGNPKIFCICRKPERPNMIGCDFLRRMVSLQLPQPDEIRG